MQKESLKVMNPKRLITPFCRSSQVYKAFQRWFYGSHFIVLVHYHHLINVTYSCSRQLFLPLLNPLVETSPNTCISLANMISHCLLDLTSLSRLFVRLWKAMLRKIDRQQAPSFSLLLHWTFPPSSSNSPSLLFWFCWHWWKVSTITPINMSSRKKLIIMKVIK